MSDKAVIFYRRLIFPEAQGDGEGIAAAGQLDACAALDIKRRPGSVLPADEPWHDVNPASRSVTSSRSSLSSPPNNDLPGSGN